MAKGLEKGLPCAQEAVSGIEVRERYLAAVYDEIQASLSDITARRLELATGNRGQDEAELTRDMLGDFFGAIDKVVPVGKDGEVVGFPTNGEHMILATELRLLYDDMYYTKDEPLIADQKVHSLAELQRRLEGLLTKGRRIMSWIERVSATICHVLKPSIGHIGSWTRAFAMGIKNQGMFAVRDLEGRDGRPGLECNTLNIPAPETGMDIMLRLALETISYGELGSEEIEKIYRDLFPLYPRRIAAAIADLEETPIRILKEIVSDHSLDDETRQKAGFNWGGRLHPDVDLDELSDRYDRDEPIATPTPSFPSSPQTDKTLKAEYEESSEFIDTLIRSMWNVGYSAAQLDATLLDFPDHQLVVYAIASHHNTSVNTLHTLCGHSDEVIRNAARENLDTRDEFGQSRQSHRYEIASGDKSPAELVRERLAFHNAETRLIDVPHL